MGRFHESLSERSVYRRYFMPVSLESRTRHERLGRICASKYEDEIALVAEKIVPSDQSEIVGVARLIKSEDESQAELSNVISDKFQRSGIDSNLTKCLLDFGREDGVRVISAWVLSENHPMRRLLEEFGFVYDAFIVGDGAIRAALRL